MSRWNADAVLETKKGEMTFSSKPVRADLVFWLCHPLCDLEDGTEAVGSQVPPLLKKNRFSSLVKMIDQGTSATFLPWPSYQMPPHKALIEHMGTRTSPQSRVCTPSRLREAGAQEMLKNLKISTECKQVLNVCDTSNKATDWVQTLESEGDQFSISIISSGFFSTGN